MKTIELKLPDNISLSEHDAAMIVAGKLYEEGLLSGSEAAELAGLTKRDFLEQLSKYGFSVFGSNTNNILSDLSNE